MASKPLHLTTPMRKMRKEEATKGAVSKFAAASRAEPIVNHGKSAVVGLPRSPRLMKTTSSPLRSQKKPKSRTHAENGIPPTVPTPSATELTRPSTVAQRRHQPVSKTTSGLIRKPPAGTQQHPKAARSTSTVAAATTIVDQSASKKSQFPMPANQRRVEPHELDKLEEEEEDLSCNLTRVRKRLQYLNSIVILQRPPLIAQRQQQQSAIRTNSGAASPGAPASSPSGGTKPKRRRSRSFGSISKPKLKSRTPVMVLRALADSKEIEQLKKEERDLDSKLNRVQETIQSLKATIVIRRPMKREDVDKQMNQLEGATALVSEVLPVGDEYLSVDDGFQPDSSPKTDQLSGDVEIHSTPVNSDLILDASMTESPSAAIYMDLRRRTIMATPPTGRRYQYRRPKQ